MMIGAENDNVSGNVGTIVGSTERLKMMRLSVERSIGKLYSKATNLAFVPV